MDLFSQRGPTFIEPPTFIEVYGTPDSQFLELKTEQILTGCRADQKKKMVQGAEQT